MVIAPTLGLPNFRTGQLPCGLTMFQVLFLFSLLPLGLFLLGSTIDTKLVCNMVLFVGVTVGGLWLCDQTRRDLEDPRLRILSSFWLIKVGMTFILLYAGWIPGLSPGGAHWGYDPQRYYYDAWDLVQKGWEPTVGSNYQGALYFYGVVFFLFGHNPVAPAMVNISVTLLGTLVLVRGLYRLSGKVTPRHFTISCILLIPEMLWYDVMTSRETMMAALVIWINFAVGCYVIGVRRCMFFKTLLIAGFAIFAILVVRTSMAIPIVASVGLMVLLLRSQSGVSPLAKILFFVLAVVGLLSGALVQQVTGGYKIDLARTFSSILSFDTNVAANQQWDPQSVGLLIAPKNLWQAVIFVFPRVIAYIAAPLPNFVVPVEDLLGGVWGAWQNLMTIPTSFMMIILFPLVLSATADAWHKRRRQPGSLVVLIAFWTSVLAVAGGNIIIHERYRVMFTPLLFASAWLGYVHCSFRQTHRWAFLWMGLLLTGSFLYFVYKAELV